MKRSYRSLLVALMLLARASLVLPGAEPIGGQTLVAMPLLQQGMTWVSVSAGAMECQLSVDRALSAHAIVLGTASTRDVLDLGLRLLLPIDLAPAFFAIELSPQHVTGLMTLFLGPVSVDLGRRWLAPARWVWLQLTVHPRLSLVAGIQEINGELAPCVGWRVFPKGSARWEVELTAARDEMTLTFRGVL